MARAAWSNGCRPKNKTDVDNPTQNRHGITGYLGDPEVARRIHEAVVG